MTKNHEDIHSQTKIRLACRPGDRAVAGDWDGNGTTTPGVVRKDGAAWHWYLLRNDSSGGSADNDFSYGVAGDGGVAGDWDGN